MSTLIINLVHISIGIFALILLWLSKPGTSLFSWHPTLMSLGMMVFSVEGLLLMVDNRVSSKQKITVHWIGQVVGVLLSYIGATAIYTNKEMNGAPHYTTWHGIIGLITLILLTIQSFGGIPAKYAVAISKIIKVKPALIKKGHRISGVFTSVLAFTSVFLALYSSWFLSVTSTSPALWWVTFAVAIHPRIFFTTVRVQHYMKYKTFF